jgi:predicted dienelactone hydrolase
MERFPALCRRRDDGSCRAFRRHFGTMDAAYLARARESYAEPRIRAAVAIAPGFTEAMTAASLRSLRAPVLLIAGAHDQQLPPATHVRPMLRHFRAPNVYREIADAQHFSFLPVCGPGAEEILAETNEEFVCREAGARTRDQIHAETLTAIARFLERHGLLRPVSARSGRRP